jgi:HK97 gp10 family phage protein
MSNDFHALSAWLGELGNGVGARMGVATQKTVTDTVNQARALAPVDTGNLRASIHGSTQIGATSVVGEVTASAHYAIYVEQGTSRMAPQPFMRPAQEATTPAWLQAIAQAGGTPR